MKREIPKKYLQEMLINF